MSDLTLDSFWRCPRCGVEMASGEPMFLLPPHCGMGHERVEMEQITASAFASEADDE